MFNDLTQRMSGVPHYKEPELTIKKKNRPYAAPANAVGEAGDWGWKEQTPFILHPSIAGP